ncbi:MAG: DUF2510 domain-containing protein [Rhodoglobus sp.]
MSDLILDDRVLQSTLPIAGWYPDPTGAGGLRWWGGLAWTEHVKPRPAAL